MFDAQNPMCLGKKTSSFGGSPIIKLWKWSAKMQLNPTFINKKMLEIRRRKKKHSQLTWAPVFPKKNGLQTSSAMAAGVPWPFMARSAAWMVTSTCARGQRSGAWRRGNGFVGEKKSGQIWYDLIIESYLSHLASRFLCVYLSMGFNVSICLSIYIMLAIYTYLFIPSSIYLHILVYNRLYRQFEQDCVDTSVVFPIASRSPLPPGLGLHSHRGLRQGAPGV